MKRLKIFSRFVLGVVFLFSGFVKAIDPLGSAYKFFDYFHAFGLEFLDGLSLPLGIFLASFEIVLGLVLILGYQKKRTYWILLVFMGFFTLLTFILALTNPVTDCGCFGDALVLTNWETFFKNLFLMVFVLVLFSSRKRTQDVHAPALELLLVLLFFAGSIMMSVTALRHLPFIDFRPYDIGTYIPEEMVIPEGAPTDKYETVLYYKNLETGDVEEFGLEDYPDDTTLYVFETSESELVSKGYEPPIHDFGILNPDGMDVTDALLNDEDYTLLMISHNLEKADGSMLAKGNRWSDLDDISGNFKFIPVTASAGTLVEEVVADNGLEFSFYSADETMLKTVIRSNPGFVLLKHGTIVGKWADMDFPEMEEWNPTWRDKILQFKEEQDPEILMLIEEGYMDGMNLDLIDFERDAVGMVTSLLSGKKENAAWIIYIMGILLLLVTLGSRSSNKA